MSKPDNNENTVDFILTNKGIHENEKGIKAIQSYIAKTSGQDAISYDFYQNQVVFQGIPEENAKNIVKKTREMLSGVFDNKYNLTYEEEEHSALHSNLKLGSSKTPSSTEERITIEINNSSPLQFNKNAMEDITSLVQKHAPNQGIIHRTSDGLAIANITANQAQTLREEFSQIMNEHKDGQTPDMQITARDQEPEQSDSLHSIKITPQEGFELSQIQQKILSSLCDIYGLKKEGRHRDGAFARQKTQGLIISEIPEEKLSTVKKELSDRLGRDFLVKDVQQKQGRALSEEQHNGFLPYYT